MLDELRRKSSYARQNYAFWGALSVTALIAIAWLTSLPMRLGNLDAVLEGEGLDQTAGSVSELLDGIKGLKEEAGNALKNSTASSSSKTTDSSNWSLDTNANDSAPTADPILIATSSRPSTPAPKSIQIATSSAPNR
jgi:hypothetical protein